METFSDLTKPGSSVYFQYNYPRASKTQRLWKLCDSLFGLYFIVCFTFNTSREKTVRGRLRSTDVFGKLEASPKDYKRGKYRPRFSVWSISNDYELFLLIPELFLYCFPAKVSLYMFYFDSLHKWKAKHKKHENKVEGYMHLREDSEILPGEHVASSSLQYIKYTVGIHSVHDWAFHCHLCFTVCVCVCVNVCCPFHWASSQPVSKAQQLSNSFHETLLYHNNQPMALKSGSLYKQRQIGTSMAEKKNIWRRGGRRGWGSLLRMRGSRGRNLSLIAKPT